MHGVGSSASAASKTGNRVRSIRRQIADAGLDLESVRTGHLPTARVQPTKARCRAVSSLLAASRRSVDHGQRIDGRHPGYRNGARSASAMSAAPLSPRKIKTLAGWLAHSGRCDCDPATARRKCNSDGVSIKKALTKLEASLPPVRIR